MTTSVQTLDDLVALKGRHLGASGWVEIDQGRIDRFAEATGDHQWIHVDAERAKDGPFGTTIAHGYLTLSLVPALLKDLWTVEGAKLGLNYGLEKVRFPSPVPVGSRLRLDATVGAVEDLGGGWAVVPIDTTIEREGGEKPACVAQVVFRYQF